MIRQIAIENFKGFQKETISFKELTLFTGINGMGKSSCIQSLLLLRQSYLMGKLIDSGLFLDGDYCKPGNGKDIFFFGASETEKLKFNIISMDDKVMDFSFNYSKDSDLQPLDKFNSDTDISLFNLFNGNFFYLNADRLSPERDIFPASQSNISNGTLGKHGQYTVHYIAYNQRKPLAIVALKHPKSSTESLLENIENWMKDITPGIKLQAQFYPEINSARLGFNYENEKGVTDEFKPINVGYGLTYVLPIITQILISQPGQIIVIENPESHLHPSGQSTIAKLCSLAANSGVQIILETHSDHIINGILVEINKNHKNPLLGIPSNKVQIQFVERETGTHRSKATEIAVKEDGRVEKAPKDFFDQFAKDMKTIMGF